ncbi:MAG: N-6 DNA methylase [Bacteroidetes bacterium]|nr:N-6 DNA methylase [Bacteroidota bacterium]
MASFSVFDFNEKNGLVLTKTPNCHNDYERLYLAQIADLNPFAVFFKRHFKSDNEEKAFKSEPVVCIFDEKDVPTNSNEHLNIHRALWSQGQVDLYIIRSASLSNIFQARKPAKKDKENPQKLTVAHLKLSDEVERQLQEEISVARLFGTGTFWEKQWDDKEITNVEKSGPYQHLLEYIIKARTLLLPKFGNAFFTVDKLLITSVLVKFLEEKKDHQTDRHTLTSIYQKLQTENLVSAIKEGKLLKLIDLLSTEFNGGIFNQFNTSEKEFINATSLNVLVDFLEAKIEIGTGQTFLWEQYSFEHLPPEVISAIYENFIQDESKRKHDGQIEKGVVYTPTHLVNLMVDEAMPLSEHEKLKNGSFKVLDPTCGSGIFLVSAYKRLLQWWAINRYHETGNIEYPDKDTAQKLLEDNIFGVDVKQTAVLVSIFSLTTTLIDYLSPKEDWEKFRFQDLSKNVIEAESPEGFFKWAAEAKRRNERIDLVIGNPPFNPETGKKKEDVVKQERLNALGVEHKIPRGNFALTFFEASMQLAKSACMIIPSSIALYDKAAQDYRKHLFTEYTVSKIFDFTHLRRMLFKSADTPVVVLNVINEPSAKKPIEHIVVKRNTESEKKLRFEIDHYDIHLVPFNRAIDPDKQFVWKTNLLGGGRLFQLIYRFSLLPSFLVHFDKMGWRYSIGYITKHSNKPAFECDYLANKYALKAGSIKFDGSYDVRLEESQNFVEIRNQELFEPPLLVFSLKIAENHLQTVFPKEYLPFNSSFVGVSAPIKDKSELEEVYKNISGTGLISDMTRLFILSTSPKALVYHEKSIVKADIDSIPYIGSQKLDVSKSDQIIMQDVLRNSIHLAKQITPKHDGYILHKPIKANEPQPLKDFTQILCQELNDIYEQETNAWQTGKIVITKTAIICQIGFGKKGQLKTEVRDTWDVELKNLLVNNAANRSISYKRIVKYYEHIDGFDCVFLIKPNANRYWLKSIALRDADDIFKDFKKEGY